MMLIVLLLLPLAAAAISGLARGAGRAKGVTLATSIATAAVAGWACFAVLQTASHRVVAISHWIAVDPLGVLITLLVAVIGATASLFSVGYMKETDLQATRRYYVGLNLFLFSMLAVPLMQEPNMVWTAIELTTLFSVLLVAFYGRQESLEAAWKYAILTLMGAAIALFGFLVLYWAARQAGLSSFDWEALAQGARHLPPMLGQVAFLLILVGFGVKVGLFPLHTWLPDAHSQAPTPICALLSGVETSAVLYVILRLFPIERAIPGNHAAAWALGFGLASVAAAAFLLLQVTDLKRLFAFSTVEHMGIVLAAIGLGTGAASFGATLQLVGHAFAKSLCFYAAGLTILTVGTQEISGIRALIRRHPAMAAAVLFSSLAIAGAPPFALFLSEFNIVKAGVSSGQWLPSTLLLLFIAIAFFGVLGRAHQMVFQGDSDAVSAAPAMPTPRSGSLALALSALPVLLFGVYLPRPLTELLHLAAQVIAGGH